MIEWGLAERVAGYVAGSPVAGQLLRGDLDALAAEAERRVVTYTQLAPAAPLPPPEAVSRSEWIAANLASLRPLLDPIAGRIGGGAGRVGAPLRLASGVLLAGELGAVTGYLAQRVLGQYDIALMGPERQSRLLFVAGNLNEAASRMRADRGELLGWVAFHEVTHAVQFASVPWLRDHLAGTLRDLIDGLELRLGPTRALRTAGRDELRDMLGALRRRELVTLMIGPERRALVDSLQTTMAVVEGHAEHVMDVIGAEVLPSQPRLRAAIEQRRSTRSAPLRLIERLLGLELKMRQYRDGKRFCDEVVEHGGVEALNRVWSEPAALPTKTELADPGAWLARTAVP